MDDMWAYIKVLTVGLIAAILLYFLFFDFEFEMPRDKAITISDYGKSYNVIYDGKFSGFVTVNSDQSEVKFVVENLSRGPYWFDGAKYYLWVEDVGYGLGSEKSTDILSGGELILNPGQTMTLSVTPRLNLLISKASGFSIMLEDGTKIRFGYQKLSLWGLLQWALIRRDLESMYEISGGRVLNKKHEDPFAEWKLNK